MEQALIEEQSVNPTRLLLACLIRLAVPLPGADQPTVTLQPNSQSVIQGVSVAFLINPTGTAPVSYQWRLDGHDLPGQTGKTLAFAGAQPADEDDYPVVVANGAGTHGPSPAQTISSEAIFYQ